MSSPEENSSKDKDTNGIQNPEAQSGLQKAGELSSSLKQCRSETAVRTFES